MFNFYSTKIFTTFPNTAFIDPKTGSIPNFTYTDAKSPKELNKWLDLKANYNTPVYAVADGKAEYVGLNGTLTSGYGKFIRIDHGNGLKSFYGHLNSYNIEKGQKVKQGQQIGLSGSTGTSTGPHLHFGVLKNNSEIDNPINYLPKF